MEVDMGKKVGKFKMVQSDAVEEVAKPAQDKQGGVEGYKRGEQVVENVDYLSQKAGETVYIEIVSKPRREIVPSANQRSRTDEKAWVADVIDLVTSKKCVYILGDVLYNNLVLKSPSWCVGGKFEILKISKEGKRYKVFDVWSLESSSDKK